MNGGSGLGSVLLLLVVVVFLIVLAAIGVLSAILTPDAPPTPPEDPIKAARLNQNDVAPTDRRPLIIVIALAACAAVPLIAWNVIKPLS